MYIYIYTYIHTYIHYTPRSILPQSKHLEAFYPSAANPLSESTQLRIPGQEIRGLPVVIVIVIVIVLVIVIVIAIVIVIVIVIVIIIVIVIVIVIVILCLREFTPQTQEYAWVEPPNVPIITLPTGRARLRPVGMCR